MLASNYDQVVLISVSNGKTVVIRTFSSGRYTMSNTQIYHDRLEIRLVRLGTGGSVVGLAEVHDSENSRGTYQLSNVQGQFLSTSRLKGRGDNANQHFVYGKTLFCVMALSNPSKEFSVVLLAPTRCSL